MRATHLGLLMLTALVLAVGAWEIAYSGTDGHAPSLAPTRYEYAVAVLGESKLAFFEAARETVFTPPTQSLPNHIAMEGVDTTYYQASTTPRHSSVPGVLNLLGAQGWEAVSIMSSTTGVLVLMKRPAP